jgi:oligopeptide/dipeptide ABC transporter ATP-binding protein
LTAPLVDVRHLNLRLPVAGGLRLILDDITFAIQPGEAVGLVGESGSGKTMTGRSLARLLPRGAQRDGEVLFDGRSIDELRGRALREWRASALQVIFQDPRAHVNPVRRIGDFLTEALRANQGLERSAAERRVLELLERVGVSNGPARLRQYPHELSGGLLQRIMIASALAVEPRLLIADEPTTALDVTTQSDVMAILDELRQERGMAMIFITHDLELAAAICDRTVVMYAGTIAEDHASGGLHAHPLHPYTVALLSSRPRLTEKVRRLAAIPGRPQSAAEAPPGCPFGPRCGYHQDECDDHRPRLRPLNGARVACIRAESVEGELRASVTGGTI